MHHIVPKCLGGLPNGKVLTAAEKEAHHENLISNGRNGHASIRYYYKDVVFESRKELLEYLHSKNLNITSSAIRKVVHNTGTLRVYTMYKEVFDNLRWEYKNEN